MNLIIPDDSRRPLYRSVLAIVRSLGRHHSVYIASPSERLQRLQRWLRSRYCADVSMVADPNTNPELFVRDINKLAALHRLEALLPFSDEVATTACWYAHELEVALPLPPFEIFMRAINKQSTYKAAHALAIPTPRTIIATGLDEVLAGLDRNGIEYPLVLKPRQRGCYGGTNIYVQTEQELADSIQECEQIGDDWPLHLHSKPLVQEYVPGGIHDCCVLYQDGSLKAMLTQVRHRTMWPTGGVGVANITTDIPEIKEMSRLLMDELGWHGPAAVEWIKDERNGSYTLIEINPRFWGTLELSMDAGIDFADLTVRMLEGEELEEHFDYSVGVRHRWAFSEELRSVSHDKKNRLARIKEYLNPKDLLDQKCHFSARLSDPAPDLFRVIEALTWAGTGRYGRVKEQFRRLCLE